MVMVAILRVGECTHKEHTTYDREEEGSVICCIWLDSVQDGDWRLKHVRIGTKLSELVHYFECFDLVSQFRDRVNGASDLRVFLSVQTAAII